MTFARKPNRTFPRRVHAPSSDDAHTASSRPTGVFVFGLEMPDSAKANVKVIFALWLVHFTGDLYGSFVSPLLPMFADVFSLSMAQVGLLAGINRFLMFIVQPMSGYFADHYRTRLFILAAPSSP